MSPLRVAADAARLRTLLVAEPGDALPSWAASTGARVVNLAALADAAEGPTILTGAGCVLVPTNTPRFIAAARRIHGLDPAVQVVAVAGPETEAKVRRSLLFAPGLGEVWVVGSSDITDALQQEACDVTRQRRTFERTRTRLDSMRAVGAPQRAERALISDAYLAGLLRALPDAVFSTDGAGLILSVNAAAEETFGARPGGLLGERLSDVLRAGTAHGEGAALLAQAAGADHVAITFRTARGDARRGELRAASMHLPNGAEAWAVVLRDVTEQHAVTEALRAGEKSFRALADAIPTLAWTARADGYIDWYNQRWYEYTGTTPEQMAGWGWQSLHDPAVLPAVIERWTASINTGEPFEMTFPLRSAEGKFRAFLTRVVPVRDTSGRVIRWFGTNTDVESERASRARVERLQSLTEALAATRTLDDVASVMVANATVTTGARAATLVFRLPGADEAQVVSEPGLPADAAGQPRVIRLDEPGPSAQCMRTGVPVFAQALASFPLVAGGEVVGAISFAFETARIFSAEDEAFFLALARQCAQAVERARLFAAERDARARADDANVAKSQFLATMSHELRTPLNAIGGYVQLMEMGIHGPVNDGQRSVLARVNVAQTHLLRLINDILNFAKLESGRLEYDLQLVVVEEIIGDVTPLVAPQLESRRISFDTRVARRGADALRVCADAEKLRQVLLNLLSNAAKFTSEGGAVFLEASPQGDTVAIRVRDTGRGIPTDRMEAIFEPFIQVRALYGPSNEGTGLGLTISRDLARGMGGEITAESREGEGSTFTLILPGSCREKQQPG